MVDPSSEPSQPPLGAASLALRLNGIAVIVAVFAGTFAYVNGTLAPQRLTPTALLNVLEKNNGQHPGFRSNYSKGVCVAGYSKIRGRASPNSLATVLMWASTLV